MASVLRLSVCRWALAAALAVAAAGTADATERVFAWAFTGANYFPTHFWDDNLLFDSILRTQRDNVDTVVVFYENGENWYMNGIHYPKYRRPIVDDTAVVRRVQRFMDHVASKADSSDILVSFLNGHGIWEQVGGEYHSIVQTWDDNPEIVDTTMGRWLRQLPCYHLVIISSCMAFGNGRHPDSCGFATHLASRQTVPARHRTVLLTASGPQPRWSPGLADDMLWTGGPTVDSAENEKYEGTTYFHSEFDFHILTGWNGGAEPSEYWSRSGAPGFFKDSIDTNRDERISVGEMFKWDAHRNSRPGWEDHQIVDSGRISNRFIVWPRIEVIDSSDATPLSLFLPDTVDLGFAYRPGALVWNAGLDTSSIPVRLRIGGGHAGGDTVLLGPNRQGTAVLPRWTASGSGWAPVVCSTALVGDTKPDNNLLRDSVYVRQVGPRPDAAVVVLGIPRSIAVGDTVRPVAHVANCGNQAVTVPVSCRIGSVYADSGTTPVLTPGDTFAVCFRYWIAQTGRYAVCCSTRLAGDVNPGNDALRDSLNAYVCDVGAVRIIAPRGQIDSGTVVTPRAVVRNYGTDPASFLTSFRIGSTYTQVCSVATLPPGDSATVNFPVWQATRRGSFVVRCMTVLAGDQNSNNNQVIDTVIVGSGVYIIVGDETPFPIPVLRSTVLAAVELQRYLLLPGCERVAVYDQSGRRLGSAPTATGVYYLRIENQQVHKVVLTQ